MPNPRFSIITPVYIHNKARLKKLERCIGSVANQTFKDFEMIVIDDGSRYPWLNPPKYPWLKIFKQDHLERLYAANYGFREAKGEILVQLDSDDELISHYLEVVDQLFLLYPKYKVFNFGSIHIHPSYNITLRSPFRPEKKEVGHVVFGGGNIVKGTFVYKRECIKEVGMYPEVTNPWDFSTKAQEEFPELKELFTIEKDGVKTVRELGNPMGDDYFLFYKLTRKYHSLPIDKYLYIVHHKGDVRLKV